MTEADDDDEPIVGCVKDSNQIIAEKFKRAAAQGNLIALDGTDSEDNESDSGNAPKAAAKELCKSMKQRGRKRKTKASARVKRERPSKRSKRGKKGAGPRAPRTPTGDKKAKGGQGEKDSKRLCTMYECETEGCGFEHHDIKVVEAHEKTCFACMNADCDVVLRRDGKAAFECEGCGGSERLCKACAEACAGCGRIFCAECMDRCVGCGKRFCGAAYGRARQYDEFGTCLQECGKCIHGSCIQHEHCGRYVKACSHERGFCEECRAKPEDLDDDDDEPRCCRGDWW
jgi:hypothetical protein